MEIKKDFLSDKSDEALLEELKRVAGVLGKSTVTQDELKRHGRIGVTAITARFNGWNNALKRAGLTTTVERNVSDEELLEELKK